MTHDTRTDIRGMTLLRIIKSTHITNQHLEEVHHRVYGNGSHLSQHILEPPQGYYLTAVDVVYNNGTSGIEHLIFSADELMPFLSEHLRVKKEETYSQKEGRTIIATEHTLVRDEDGQSYSQKVKHEIRNENTGNW